MSLNDTYKLDMPTVTVSLAGATFVLKHHNASSVEFTKMARELMKPHKRFVANGGTLPVETEREIAVRGFVRHSLVSWQDLRINAGEECVAFSEDKAVELFLAYPKLYTDLLTEATDMEQFRRSDLADTTKN